MRDGLRQTIDWYAQHKDWWQADKAKVEGQYAKQESVINSPSTTDSITSETSQGTSKEPAN
jgi:hypothetical protein